PSMRPGRIPLSRFASPILRGAIRRWFCASRCHLTTPACGAPLPYGSHLSDDVLAWAVKQLEKLFTPGDVVLYIWVEWLREQEILWAVPAAPSQQWLNSRKQQQQLEEEGAEQEGATHGSSRRAATVKVGGLRARVTHSRLWTAGGEVSKLSAAR
ncbi:hypothetical protein Vretimale_18700, partial [Volvox reticuliferus]